MNAIDDILWALTSPECYSLFVRNRQWSAEALGDWLYAVAQEQLLAAGQTGDSRP